MAEKYRMEEKAARGQTIRTEFGRDRSDEDTSKEEMTGRLAGADDEPKGQITSGKVPSI